MENNSHEDSLVEPVLSDYSLDDTQVKNLRSFYHLRDSRITLYNRVVFVSLATLSILVIFYNELNPEHLFYLIPLSAILTWVAIPYLFKLLFRKELKQYITEKLMPADIARIELSYNEYSAARGKYISQLKFREKIIRRKTWEYWFALSATDFEEAVGDMFLDKGYKVWTTSASGDHGVDLYLEKDDKNIVVQCKTYKKVIGPNVARDLYGTMIAQNADEAILVAPTGFSQATKEFCTGKPIRLMDIDDLAKMTYDFKHYIPYWLENSQSIDDVIKGFNKNVLGKDYQIKRRRYQ